MAKNDQTNQRSMQVDLAAHAKKIGAQDKFATGVLTVIVGLVMFLLVAIIAYILYMGLGKALSPGFLTNPSTMM